MHQGGSILGLLDTEGKLECCEEIYATCWERLYYCINIVGLPLGDKRIRQRSVLTVLTSKFLNLGRFPETISDNNFGIC